jgi:hypothetical protein
VRWSLCPVIMPSMMGWIFLLLVSVIGVSFIAGTAVATYAAFRKTRGWRRWAYPISGLLMAIGAVGFFGAGFSALGGLNWLGQSFEWPVGYNGQILKLADGTYVVPLDHAGRVQVYDPDWRFRRSWAVDAGGGTFKVYSRDGKGIDVATARKSRHYVYTADGALQSQEEYPPGEYEPFPSGGVSAFVPTPWWGWVFTSPLYSWLCAGFGMAISIAMNRRRKKSSRAGAATPKKPTR